MARLSNVNEGLIQVVGRKPKLDTTYGRRNRNKSLSGVYDTMPLSPQKEFQPRRSWTSINKDQSVHQIEEASPPSNIAHKILSKSLSPSSTSAAFEPLGDSTQGGLRPRSIANVTTVQLAHVPALPSLTVSTRSPAQSYVRLPPKPTTFQLDTLKSATVETPTQAKFLPSDINQVTTGVSIVPISDDHQAGTAADNLNLGPVDNIEMADVDGEGDPGEAKQPRTHTGDNNDEYFEVEAIKSCMLGARVRCFSAFFIFILTIIFFF